MANVPRLSKILRGKEKQPQTELEAAIKYALDHAGGGGGGGDIVIDATISENTITIDPDVDLSKIYTEYKAGKTVKLFVPIAEYGYVSDYILIGARYTAENDYALDFAMTAVVEENTYVVSALHFLNSRTTTGTVYNASDKQPLNVEIASVSGTAITLATPAKAINDAYLAHRPVFCDIAAEFGSRAYLQVCHYSNDSSYHIAFATIAPSSSGSIQIYWVIFDDSLTGELHADTIYTPNP